MSNREGRAHKSRTEDVADKALEQFEAIIRQSDPLQFKGVLRSRGDQFYYEISIGPYEILIGRNIHNRYIHKSLVMDEPITIGESSGNNSMRIFNRNTGTVHKFEGPRVDSIFRYIDEASQKSMLQDAASKLSRPKS